MNLQEALSPTDFTNLSAKEQAIIKANNPQLSDSVFSIPTHINENNWKDYLKLRADSGDSAALDYLMNWYMSEESAKTARNWEHERNKNSIPEMVESMKKAGINPYWLDSLGGAPSYSGSGNKYSSSAFLSQVRANETERKNTITAILSAFGTVVSAIGMLALFGKKGKR